MKFLSFDKPLKTDVILVVVYVVITLLLFLNTYYNSNFSGNKKIILAYIVFSQMSIYSLFYRGLRNGYLFIVHVLLGILEIIFWQIFRDEPQLQFEIGFAGTGLRYTLILIVLFQTLRLLHLEFFKSELETVMHGGRSLFEERKLKWSDWLCGALYFMTMIFLWT